MVFVLGFDGISKFLYRAKCILKQCSYCFNSHAHFIAVVDACGGTSKMSEYDLQFQADLEKAQALSLESLALEQFRRQKQISSAGN